MMSYFQGAGNDICLGHDICLWLPLGCPLAHRACELQLLIHSIFILVTKHIPFLSPSNSIKALEAAYTDVSNDINNLPIDVILSLPTDVLVCLH